MIQNRDITDKTYGSLPNPHKKIAHFLDVYGIPFDYKQPMQVQSHECMETWHPDFALWQSRVIIEYMGRNESASHQRHHKDRIQTYQMNGKSLLPWYESDFTAGWESQLLNKIYDLLQSQCPPAIRAYNNALQENSACENKEINCLMPAKQVYR